MKASGPVGKARAFSLRKHLRTRFISGLIVLIPLAVTIFMLNLVFSTLEAAAMPFVRPLLKNAPPVVLRTVAVVLMAAFVYLMGLIASHIVGQRLIRWGETLLLKLPLIKSVYTASKQVVDIFSTNQAAAFQSVVLVIFPHPDSTAVGFVTGVMRDPNGHRRYRIFVPTTPNPTSGFLLILPETQISFTDIPVEEGIRMVVSGGVLAPAHYKIVPPQIAGSVPAAPPPGL